MAKDYFHAITSAEWTRKNELRDSKNKSSPKLLGFQDSLAFFGYDCRKVALFQVRAYSIPNVAGQI